MKQKIISLGELEFFHEHECLVKNRIIYLGSTTLDVQTGDEGGIDFISASTTIKNLIYLDSIDNSPITLICNTPGGDILHGMAIYDIIKGLNSEVTVLGVGKVMSMGTILMQACKNRFLMNSTCFMIHDGECGAGGDPKSAKAWIEYYERERKNSYKIYLDRIKEKHPKYNLKDIEKMCEHDNIMSADEAVELGLADKVITKLGWS